VECPETRSVLPTRSVLFMRSRWWIVQMSVRTDWWDSFKASWRWYALQFLLGPAQQRTEGSRRCQELSLVCCLLSHTPDHLVINFHVPLRNDDCHNYVSDAVYVTRSSFVCRTSRSGRCGFRFLGKVGTVERILLLNSNSAGGIC
jgi:hypothetical protein